ncbi:MULTISPECIES: tyrosine-type recombinase/integrase [Bradyrhizobium]|uniref:tyrosine-type recombinase/integrase n=1 Tax=Bradyrhizobium TaxID=374 RepID=UPI000231D765|nr:site-specific integrase [Bradyrhizobium japonicum]AHY50544.1 phage integrase family protein [Bradyrhizobium japonicum SEMIA 5079]AJA63252.1 integrase [Bradyrhizobium japonicum]KMJ98782.1 integrase [Bradyrhizobium japonicum]MCD9109935.1 integrase arm-type DNA-binding domain-containing protein [Bradyrhizobium japonicum]MCD9256659.1 integrase arm-type DNA-binding domain-containing protein [Bradyrhizobium japonicum SEMIA 5079]
MARNRLTTTQCNARRKAGKLADGDGLYLQTSPNGNKSFVFVFIRSGRRREMGLGPFGTGTGQVSLAAARDKADEVRAILGRGGDPFTELSSRRATSRSFGAYADEWVAGMEEGWRNEKHRAQWKSTLGTTYCATLRKRPIGEVTTDDVIKVLKPIWRTKAETARRIRGRIERVLDAARAAGERSGENPARWRGHLSELLSKPEKLQRGHHKAMPHTDVPAFMTRLRAMNGIAALSVEFTILTAARSGESRGATWSEIKDDLWVVPPERMKGGREHRVPLVPRALEILEQMKKLRTSNIIFPGFRDDRPLSDMSLSAVLRRLKVDATVHGFRSSFRDWAGDATDFPRELAEAALAHLVGDETERAYRRGDALKRRRELMEAWAEYLGRQK